MMGNTWERISTVESPSLRVNAAITYDPKNQIVLLFGGLAEDETVLQDTWVFKETEIGREWINISPSPSRQ